MTQDELIQTLAKMPEGELSADQIAEVVLTIESKVSFWKQIQKELEAAMIEHIKTTGRPLVIGQMLYSVGQRKETKCRDVRETLATLLETFGPERVGDCLSSSAFKYGQVRKMLADAGDTSTFATLFTTEEKDVLNEKGEKVDALQKINLEFTRG